MIAGVEGWKEGRGREKGGTHHMRTGLVTLVWMVVDITLVGTLIGSEKECNCKHDAHVKYFHSIRTIAQLKTSKSGWSTLADLC